MQAWTPGSGPFLIFDTNVNATNKTHSRVVGVTRMMGPKVAKNGGGKNQRTGHKIGPRAFPEVILIPGDREFRPRSF